MIITKITKIDATSLVLNTTERFDIGKIYILNLTLPTGSSSSLLRRIRCRVKITDVTENKVTGRFVSLRAEDLRFLKERQ